MRIGPVGQGEGVYQVEAHVERVQRGESHNVEDVDKAIETIQKKMEKFRNIVKSEAEFKIDRKTGMVIVKIKDKETGEVVRQIPPEVVVRLARTIEEFLGMLFDERA